MRHTNRVALAVAGALVTWVLGAGSASAHIPTCVESVNPHGQNTPPAGSTTLPGPNGGQNDDGFYKISSDVGTNVFVVTGGVTFGPFPSGSVVKYTQAPGAAPTAEASPAPIEREEVHAVMMHAGLLRLFVCGVARVRCESCSAGDGITPRVHHGRGVSNRDHDLVQCAVRY